MIFFLDNYSIYAISNSNYYRNRINDFNDGRVIDCHNHSGAKRWRIERWKRTK